jgi:glutamate-1-semialdehyde 2,1-aminomutase
MSVSVTTLKSAELDRFERERPRSREAYERARQVLPGGVAQHMRAMQPFPITIARGAGARKWDVDGHEYIDYHFGSGALLLGYSHPEVIAAIQERLPDSWHFAQPHPLEAEWGEMVQRLVPSAERVRFVNSGTEADLLAIRLARAFSGKPKVLRFEGHYHGWQNVGTLGQSPPFDSLKSPGITPGEAQDVVIRPANDIDLVANTLDADSEIGTVILEPSGASWSTVPLRPGFLQGLRQVTADRGVVLIFDEVITGFRWSSGGAQVRFGITPDLTSMAKIVSGGMPGAAVGGRAEIMNCLVSLPSNSKERVAQGGTFNANPLGAAAGLATLKIASTGEPQRHADALCEQLKAGLNESIKRLGISGVAYGESSTFHVYLGPRPAGTPVGEKLWTEDATTIKSMSKDLVDAVRQALQNRGVDLMSGIGGMVSAAHTPADIDQTVVAFEGALKAVRDERPDLMPA